MAFKCDGCNAVFENEDSLVVFTDEPSLAKKIGLNGNTLSSECPLCGGIVHSIDEQQVSGPCVVAV